MKRHTYAFMTGAALVASLLVGGFGIAQANTDDTAAQTTAVSKATAPKDINGQVELAAEPSNMSQAPKANDANGQIELATAPGHTSTAVEDK